MSKYKQVPMAELTIDKAYQRPLDDKRVRRMVKDFSPAMLGTLDVSRHNGKCIVFDGQHRLAALKELGRKTAPCLVHENLTQAQEADLFYRLQRDRKPIHPVQAFRARCVAGDEQALEIERLVEGASYRIGFTRDAETISAVATLDRIRRQGFLAETLELLQLWKGDVGATESTFLDGLSLLCKGYGHRIGDAERQKLAAVPATVITRNAISAMVRKGGWANAKNRGSFVLSELRKAADLRGVARGSRGRRVAA